MSEERRGITIPYIESVILRWLIVLATIIAFLYLVQIVWTELSQFSEILLLLFLAWLLSFILDPLVRYLHKLSIPRLAAAALVYLTMAGIFAVIGLVFIPLLAAQTGSFINILAVSQSQSPHLIESLQQSLAGLGITVDLNTLVRNQLQSAQTYSAAALSQTVLLAASVFNFLFDSLIVLIFSFYFVVDGERAWRVVLAHLPDRFHKEVAYIKDSISYSFSGFLRTQVLLGLIMGISTYLILWLFGVDFAITAATLSGLAMIMPVIGPLISVVPPIGVALVTQPSKALFVFIIIFVLQALIVNIIGPLLFKRTVGLHPVIVILSFLVGLKVLGPWGAVFAVPVAGVLILIGSLLLRHWVQPNRTVTEAEKLL